MKDKKMNPQELVKWFAGELRRGQSIVIHVKILNDTVKGLDLWEGIKESELTANNYLGNSTIKLKNHCTLTLKKYVKK